MEFIKWYVQGLDEKHNPKELVDIFGMFKLNQIDLQEDVFGGESKIRSILRINELLENKDIKIDEWAEGVKIKFYSESEEEFEKVNTTIFNNIIKYKLNYDINK